jgi:hypothetical protein
MQGVEHARTALYEDMVERLAALITRHREANTEVMRFCGSFRTRGKHRDERDARLRIGLSVRNTCAKASDRALRLRI